ncbi:MAG: hypothetical protein LBJ67_03480, partial [Planctomycetaceae bacterium]|nr:hypothetical protein [Planctomycetaceae bacterium]
CPVGGGARRRNGKVGGPRHKRKNPETELNRNRYAPRLLYGMRVFPEGKFAARGEQRIAHKESRIVRKWK